MLADTLDSGLASAATWLTVLLDAGVKGAAILLVAGGFSALLRRTSAAARHFVWLLALASLLALPALSVALPAWRLPILPQELAPAEPVPTALIETSAPPQALPQIGTPAEPLAVPLVVGAEGLPEPEPTEPVHWSVWVLVVWGAGVIAVLFWLMVGTVRVWSVARGARLVPEGSSWSVLLKELARRLGVRSPARLLQSEWVSVPMMWGVARPVVLLPPDGECWPEERRRIVLLHELAHIRRKDCATQTVAQLACALYWFNPLAWLAARQMRVERERACDDLVLGAGFKASSYAGHLLEIARSARALRCAALAGVAMARPSHIEGRLLAILDATRSRRSLTRFTIAVALMVVTSVVLPLAALKPTAAATEGVGAAHAPEEPGARWTAKLASGISVELLGVSYNPSVGQPWWKPDGSLLSQPPYDSMGGRAHAEEDVQAYEFAIRIAKPPVERFATKWLIVPAVARAGGEPKKNGQAVPNLWANAVSVPRSHDTCTVAFGLASGSWQQLTSFNGIGGPQATAHRLLGDVVFSPASEVDGNARVNVAHAIEDKDCRVIALDREGQIHHPQIASAAPGEAGLRLMVATFKGLPLFEVKEFQFQVRPYQWAEFQNVSLKPGHNTSVKVVPGSLRAQKAGAEEAVATAAAAAPGTTPTFAQPGLTFGPVIERVVNDPDWSDTDLAIDLDTGTLFGKPAEEFGDDLMAAFQWAVAEGIDARSDSSGKTLVGLGMVVKAVPNERWETITPGELAADADLLEGRTRSPLSPIEMHTTTPPATYLFRTREGGAGILQITGFTAGQRAVKIRYKMLMSRGVAAAPLRPGRVVLPVNAFFDLATGRVDPTPEVDDDSELLAALEKRGRGDLVYSEYRGWPALAFVRGARVDRELPLMPEFPDVPVPYAVVSPPWPYTLEVTTRQGRRYALSVLSADDESCLLEYVPLAAEKREATEPAVQKAFIPDTDMARQGARVVLDLASGEMLPAGEGEEQLVGHFERLGKGDLAYDRAFICLRGGKASLWQDGKPIPLNALDQVQDATVYEIPEVPYRVLIITGDNAAYQVTVLSKDENGINVEYRKIEAQASTPEEAVREKLQRKVTFSFAETPLEQVVDFVHTVADLNIVLDPRIRDAKPVSVRLEDVALEDALSLITELVGLKWTIRRGVVFISDAKGVQAAAEAEAEEAVLEKFHQRKITFSFTNRPLEDVVDFIRRVGDVSFIVDHRVLAAAGPGRYRITLSLTDVPLEDALDIILDQVDLEWGFRGGRVFISDAKGVQGEPDAAEKKVLEERRRARAEMLARDKVVGEKLQRKVTLGFAGTPLVDVVEFFRTVGDLNIVLDQRVQQDKSVTLSLRDVPLEDALDLITEVVDLKWTIRRGVVFISDAKGVQAPDAEEKKALEERRRARAEMLARDRALGEKLQRKVTFNFAETPLVDVVDFIREVAELNILLVEFGDRRIQADIPLTLSLRDVAVEDALDYITGLVDLEWTVRQGAVFISNDVGIEAARQEGERVRAVMEAARQRAERERAVAEWRRMRPEAAAEEKALREKLQRKITFSFSDTPLVDVVEFIRTVGDLNVVLDQRVQQDKSVTLGLSDVPLEDALDLTTEVVDLKWTTRRGVVFISDLAGVMPEPLMRIYDIRDIVTEEKAEALVTRIREEVEPETWRLSVGFSIGYRGGNLVVVQIDDVHQKIQRFLEGLRGAGLFCIRTLAKPEERDQLTTKMVDLKTGEEVWVSPVLILGALDLVPKPEVEVTERPGQPPVVRLQLTPAAAQRVKEWTQAHLGERLALVADGEVWSVLTVSEPFPGDTMGLAAPDAERARRFATKLQEYFGRRLKERLGEP